MTNITMNILWICNNYEYKFRICDGYYTYNLIIMAIVMDMVMAMVMAMVMDMVF